MPPESDDDDEERAPSKATDAEMPPPPPLFSLVIEGDAPHKGGMGPSGLESNQCVNAELNGLQLVLMPTHLPGLVRYLKGAIELAKPLLISDEESSARVKSCSESWSSFASM